jgi:hypothetical protein
MPRRNDDLLSITLGEPLAPAKTPKNRDSSSSGNNDEAGAQAAESSGPVATGDSAANSESTRAQADEGIARLSASLFEGPAQRSAEKFSASSAEELEGYIEVRPIGTTQGLKELAQLYKKTGGELGALERKVHMMLWPLALHFGLYMTLPGRESKRPPLVGAFWARSLAEAPITLGHLFPAALFKGIMAGDVWEFGGMAVDPDFRRDRLIAVMTETIRLFLFSRRPELVIATPVESLHDLYKQLSLKTVGTRPVEHPHVAGVRVYLMYGRFKELAGPLFM